MSSPKPYVFVTPPYSSKSCGIKYIHELCSELNNIGCTAYVTAVGNPELNTLQISQLNKEELISLQQEGIVVYPEIVRGNPLKFRNVVRWYLNVSDQPVLESDLIFAHGRIVQSLNNLTHLLELYYIEDCFIPGTVPRIFESASWKGKEASAIDIEETTRYTCIKITYESPATRTALASLLHRCKVLYTYDNFTGLILEARMCGCPVIVIPDDKIPLEYSKTLHRFGTEGLFFYGESIDRTRMYDGIENVRRRYDEYKTTMHVEQISNFIELTQRLDSTYQENLQENPLVYEPWIGTDLFR